MGERGDRLRDDRARVHRRAVAASSVELSHGTVYYRDRGAGPTIVFLHGYLMGGGLWEPVVRLLEGEFRCVVPELPFGAHPAGMLPDADLTPAGLGRLVAGFLDALELSDVVLVGNDSGAAIAQVVAARHATRLGGLVLATGDAFDNFPPKQFRPLIAIARARALTPMLSMLKFRRPRSLPTAFGWLTLGEPPHELIDLPGPPTTGSSRSSTRNASPPSSPTRESS